MGTAKLTGHAAIEAADRHCLTLSKHADPTGGVREGLSLAEARAIVQKDPDLVS
jgi:hypothetical protein